MKTDQKKRKKQKEKVKEEVRIIKPISTNDIVKLVNNSTKF